LYHSPDRVAEMPTSKGEKGSDSDGSSLAGVLEMLQE